MPGRVHVLGNSRAGQSEYWDSMLRGAHRRNPRMQGVLLLTPISDVHGRNDERLCALSNESIGDPSVTQIVTDTDSDFSPRRMPYLLFGRRKSVIEKLNRDGFGMLENYFP